MILRAGANDERLHDATRDKRRKQFYQTDCEQHCDRAGNLQFVRLEECKELQKDRFSVDARRTNIALLGQLPAAARALSLIAGLCVARLLATFECINSFCGRSYRAAEAVREPQDREYFPVCFQLQNAVANQYLSVSGIDTGKGHGMNQVRRNFAIRGKDVQVAAGDDEPLFAKLTIRSNVR